MYQYVAFPKCVYNTKGETRIVGDQHQFDLAKADGFDEPENLKPQEKGEPDDAVRDEKGRGQEASEEVTSDELTDGAPESVEAPKPRRGRPPKSERSE